MRYNFTRHIVIALIINLLYMGYVHAVPCWDDEACKTVCIDGGFCAKEPFKQQGYCICRSTPEDTLDYLMGE